MFIISTFGKLYFLLKVLFTFIIKYKTSQFFISYLDKILIGYIRCIYFLLVKLVYIYKALSNCLTRIAIPLEIRGL